MADDTQGGGPLASIAQRLPGVRTFRTYERRSLRHDLVAGVGLAVLLVPQGMAYAELAGLRPVIGLYTTVVALVAYAIFGPSRTLVLGPDSALALLIAAALASVLGPRPDPATAIALASVLALAMGLFCVVAGLLRLGTVTELFSKPVRVGFLNGIAVVIVVSQLPKLFGFSAEGDDFVDDVRAFVEGVGDGRTVAEALAVGLASLTVILAFRAWLPQVPGIIVAVVGAIAAVELFDLAAHGVAVVGSVPSGFPGPTIPDVALDDLGTLLLAAAGMAFVTVADTTALSRTFAAKRDEDIDPNQEIVALGAANLATGLFRGFPVSASASRTAVAASTGARSQLTGVIGAAGVLVVLLFANDALRSLPSAALAAIVISAAVSLFDVATLRWLWRVRRSELWLSLSALLGVALLGVLEGIAVAIALSLGNFVWRAWRPYDAVLGRIDQQKGYHDIDRHPEAKQIPGLVIYRFDAPLFFANAEHFARRLRDAIRHRGEGVRWVIVAAEPMTDIDTTGAEVFGDVLDRLDDDHIEFAFAALKDPVKDRLRRYGLYDRIGGDRFYPTLGTAIDGYVAETGTDWVDWSDRPDRGERGPRAE